MFARSAFRVMQPMRMHARRYATEPPPSSSTSSSSTTNVLVAIGALAAGGLGYSYFSKTPTADAAKSKASTVKAAAAAATGLAAKPAFTGGEQGFISLVLDKVEVVNHNTKKFTFKLPEEDMVSGLHVASALLTKYIGPEMAKPVIRPYTPISDEDTPGEITLLVKKYPDGPMSTRLHDMQPGQRLDFKGPLPKYPWTPNKHTHVGLVAGGTGITPMFQLVHRILKNPDDRTKVTLIFGNISEDDILLRREIDQLENTYPQRFRVFHSLSKPASSWPGGSGHISKELLKTVLPEPKEDGIKLFVCGPPGMMKAISGEKVSPRDQGELTGLLKDLGYTKDQVYKF